MATLTKRKGRWRALVRRRGHTRCATFAVRKDAQVRLPKGWRNVLGVPGLALATLG